MYSKKVAIALMCLATTQINFSIQREKINDFATGICLGAAHGLANKVFPSELSGLFAAVAHIEGTTCNEATLLGHGLAQGFIEGSTYNTSNNSVSIGFSLNFASLAAITTLLFKKADPYAYESVKNAVQHDYHAAKNDLRFLSKQVMIELRNKK